MFVVSYTGPFAFIKPWTAVRDSLTFSQQFLTPSIITGIEKKLFPELLLENNYSSKIIRHKLSYSNSSVQMEQTQIRGMTIKKKQKTAARTRSIIERGVLVRPILYLAFNQQTDAERAHNQHICLCRNEDVLLPFSEILEMGHDEFNKLDGFELHFEQTKESFMVGYDRFNNGKPMFGRLEITHNPK